MPLGEKDITEKTLEAYDDVFADILNVLLFGGAPVVSEHDLKEASPRSQYKADGKLHEQERDVAKYWKNGTIRIAFYGFENQTKADPDMPLRVFGYDGAAYRAQLLADDIRCKDKDSKALRYPVITLVLYFGFKKRWDQPTTLLECLDVPKELKPFMNDYRINLFEIGYLTDEQVNSFQSDFRFVADYFVQMRRNRNYIPSSATIRHVHEFLQLMAAMTGDHRYEEIYSSDMERRRISMCEVLDRVENRGIKKGIEQGIEKGLKTGLEKGQKKGEASAFALVQYLISNNRMEDLKKASEDVEFRSQLMKELSSKKV